MDLILYNPKSKNSRSNVQTHKLVRYYKKHQYPFRLKSLLKIDDIKLYLRDKDHIDNIILLGGDGTINFMINSLYNEDIKQEIYIKRNGSGNDYLRTLKDQDSKAQTIMQVSLDNTTRYFMNGAGIGIDGLVIDYVDKAHNKGKFTYYLSTLKAMINYVPDQARCVIDDIPYTFNKTYSIMINNGKFVGGGMKMTPNANLSDDQLDIIIIHSIPKILLFFIFITVYLGLHTKFKKYVFSTKCHNISVIFNSPQIAQTDGEKFDDITELSASSTNKHIHLRKYRKTHSN
ncbi:MAG: diacylglycerol kinase family protein [Candidatus Izemoplasma sp.]|nr:diacylglycerol kinase family protein [Candidatus Izemoplasma sp.]